MAIFKGYIFVSCGCKFFFGLPDPHLAHLGTHRYPSLLVGVNRERTFLILGQFQKFQRQIIYLVNFEYFLTNWTCSVLGVEQTNSVTQLDMRGKLAFRIFLPYVGSRLMETIGLLPICLKFLRLFLLMKNFVQLTFSEKYI